MKPTVPSARYWPTLSKRQLLFCVVMSVGLGFFGSILAAVQTRVVLGTELSPKIYLMPFTVSAIFGFLTALIYYQWRNYAYFLERTSRRKEEKYHHLFENATDIIYTLDPATNLILSINPVVKTILGYTPEEIMAAPLNQLMPPESFNSLYPFLEAKLRGEIETTYELEVMAKAGHLVLLEIKSRLVKNEGGIIRVHGIARDITQRKRAELALLESEQFNKTIISSVQEGVAVCNKDLECQLWNQFMEKLSGLTADMVISQNIVNFLPDPNAVVYLRQALQGEATRSRDLSYKVGEEDRWLISRYSPHVAVSGEIVGVVVTIHDITERHILEEKLRQSQKLEAVGQLAGGVAHEFNNLLTTIIGYADIALSTLPPDNPIAGDLKGILRKANRAATLVQQLLNFSRHPLAEPRPMNLNKFLVDTKRLFSRFTHAAQVQLEVNIEPNLAQVMAAPGQIEEILFNLVANAYDAIPQGGKIEVQIANFEFTTLTSNLPHGFKLGPYIAIQVSDDGVGMSETVKANIFDLFFTTKEIGRGAGLGLAIVFGIVQQLNGHVEVESELGQGTTFRIYLPALTS